MKMLQKFKYILENLGGEKEMKKIVFGFVVASSLIVLMCPKVWANGFRLLEVQGVAAAAQTDAFCAQADDPSAV